MLPDQHKFYIPDTPLTGCVREITRIMAARGITVVLAGGAARDLWHFNIPRDLDLWVLGDADLCDVEEALLSVPGAANISTCLHSGATNVDRNELEAVFKLNHFDYNVDVIIHGQRPASLKALCGTFDMSINNAWLDVSTEFNIVCTAPDYPSVSDALPVVLNYPQSCTKERVDYIKAKYSAYWYKIQEDECAAD